jgi:hypothetical protein
VSSLVLEKWLDFEKAKLKVIPMVLRSVLKTAITNITLTLRKYNMILPLSSHC